MKKSIFIRVFSLVTVSVLLVFVFGIIGIYNNNRRMINERLEAECNLTLALLNDREDIAQLDRYDNDGIYRITVIERDGTVVYDSMQSPSMLENHSNREEFISALENKSEMVERYSQTFGCKMAYYAKLATLTDGSDIVLRIAIRSADISSYIAVSLTILAVVLIAAIVTAIFLARDISYKITQKITSIDRSIRSINAGKYIPISAAPEDTELYSVLSEINELNTTLHHIIVSEKNEKNKLKMVLDNVSQGIVALGVDGTVIFVNNSAFSMLGGGETAVGKRLYCMISDTGLAEKIMYLEKSEVFEHSLRDRVLLVTVKVISDTALAESVSRIIIFTDITSEKNIARQKSDFFANASHELKTPITVISGLSELLVAKDSFDEGSKKQLERVYRECQRMASLIQDMLKLSNLESTEAERTLALCDVAESAREIISELSEKIAQKSLTVTVSGEGSIYIDQKQLYELLGNLISNAVNYNKENGSVAVEIKSDAQATEIKVSDTGIGIDEKHLPRICERFYRVDKSRSKKTGGTGLGLAIVKHICALYGAELKIESQLGKGTAVSVVFKAD